MSDTVEIVSRFTGKYRFLSNFWPDNNATTEHLYQAYKTEDPDERIWVLDSPTPGIAKQRGRRVTLRPNWDEIKNAVMLGLLREKFPEDHWLTDLLLGTGEAKLVEGNHWNDTYWGVCDGRGKNRLGELLMQVRDERR